MLTFQPALRGALHRGVAADPHRPELLLVEDDETSRDVLSRRLAKHGFAVTVANDGAEGLMLARSQPPAVVLLDLRLPILDGWEVARRLKADPETRHVPIIALSAHALAEDRVRALAAGCDAYLSKPVDFPFLLEAVRRVRVAER